MRQDVSWLALSHPIAMLFLAGLLYLVYCQSQQRMPTFALAATAIASYGVGIGIQILGLRDDFGWLILLPGALYFTAACCLSVLVCHMAGVYGVWRSFLLLACVGLALRIYGTWWQPDNWFRVVTLQGTVSVSLGIAAWRGRSLLRRSWFDCLFYLAVVVFVVAGLARVLVIPASDMAIYGFRESLFWSLTLALVNTCLLVLFGGFLTSAFGQRLADEKQLSHTDELTGLRNRRGLKASVVARLRYANTYSIILFDLDRFKVVNDTWGHAMGDIVLQQVGYLLSSSTTNTDLVARLGGEEFAMVLPGVSLDEASAIASGLRASIESFPFGSAEQRIHCTASFGVADFNAAMSLDVALQVVDRLLYQSKEDGRNRVSATPWWRTEPHAMPS